MTRLIDANRLEKVLAIMANQCGGTLDILDISNAIEIAPTIEQRPHGEWIREVVVEEPRKNKRAYARCSACGCRYNHYGVAVKHFDYCPKCGADMRKEGEAE